MQTEAALAERLAQIETLKNGSQPITKDPEALRSIIRRTVMAYASEEGACHAHDLLTDLRADLDRMMEEDSDPEDEDPSEAYLRRWESTWSV